MAGDAWRHHGAIMARCHARCRAQSAVGWRWGWASYCIGPTEPDLQYGYAPRDPERRCGAECGETGIESRGATKK